MNFKDLVQKRRSIRKFTEDKLTAEQVETIMRAALMAPSSNNATPWQFVLVEDKSTLEQLSVCKKVGRKFISECSLAVVILADSLVSSAWIEDTSIAAIMIQLQAEDLDLGSCWVQIRGRETPDGTSSEEYIRELLNIPLQMQVLSIIAIGNKGQERPQQNEEDLQWNKLHIEKFSYE